MAYVVKFSLSVDDIYKQLTEAEKVRFNELVFTNVQKMNKDIIIEAVAIEKPSYNKELYKKMSEDYDIDENGRLGGYEILRNFE